MNFNLLGIAALIIFCWLCIRGFKRGFFKEFVSMFLIIVTFLIMGFINPHINEFIKESTPVYEKVEKQFEQYIEKNDKYLLGATEEEDLLEKLGLPVFLRKNVEENNTSQGYMKLGVDNLKEYLIAYLSDIVVSAFSFIVSFVLIQLFIKVAVVIIDMVLKLPILKQTNKIAGALLGGAKGVLFIWIVMVVLTALCNTEIGQKGIMLIREDVLLSILYEKNILLKIFMKIL